MVHIHLCIEFSEILLTCYINKLNEGTQNGILWILSLNIFCHIELN